MVDSALDGDPLFLPADTPLFSGKIKNGHLEIKAITKNIKPTRAILLQRLTDDDLYAQIWLDNKHYYVDVKNLHKLKENDYVS